MDLERAGPSGVAAGKMGLVSGTSRPQTLILDSHSRMPNRVLL